MQRRFVMIAGGTVVLLPFVSLAGCSGEKPPPASGPATPPPAEINQPPAPTAVAETATPAPAPAAPATGAAAAVPTVKLDESDPIAKTLGYRHDATQVDTTRFKVKAGPDGATQFCNNCVQYKEIGNPDWGGCGIFAGKLVAAKGWCSTYARKV